MLFKAQIYRFTSNMINAGLLRLIQNYAKLQGFKLKSSIGEKETNSKDKENKKEKVTIIYLRGILPGLNHISKIYSLPGEYKIEYTVHMKALGQGHFICQDKQLLYVSFDFLPQLSPLSGFDCVCVPVFGTRTTVFFGGQILSMLYDPSLSFNPVDAC